MSLSGSQRHLIGDVITWCAIIGMLWYIGTHFNEVRQYVSERAGLPKVETAQQAEAKPAPDAPSSDGVELRADRRGQYEASIEINGRAVDTLVDTGATYVTLSYEDAARAGIYPRDADFTWRSQTANGTTRNAPVMLDRLQIGSIMVRNVQAVVAEPGRLHVSLLGMSFLQKLRKFEIRSGKLLLQD
jgi:aspartyl protease family protein